MRVKLCVGSIMAAVCALALVACSGSNGTSASTTPTTPSPAPGASAASATTINIVSSTGNTAFSPDVVTASVGDMIVWKNSTAVLHHIVLDDGTVVGDINPGASSAGIPLKTASGNFHCTIHSTMIGSFNAAAPPAVPPCTTPGYC
jgi:plastocyanin